MIEYRTIDHFQQVTGDTLTLGDGSGDEARQYISRFASALIAVHNAILGNYALVATQLTCETLWCFLAIRYRAKY